MLQRVTQFFEHNAKTVGDWFTVGLVVTWAVSHYFLPAENWLRRDDWLLVMVAALAVHAATRLIEVRETLATQTTRLEQLLETSQVFAEQIDANRHMMQFIHDHGAKEAQLLECSSVTVREPLLKLKECGCKIKLLVRNPEMEPNKRQRNRIRDRIDELVNGHFRGYPKIEIRCYSTPASIRGRKLDGRLVCVGWYNYSGDEWAIHGHDNPVVHAYASSEEGKRLKVFFDRAFSELWDHPATVTATTVLGGGKN